MEETRRIERRKRRRRRRRKSNNDRGRLGEQSMSRWEREKTQISTTISGIWEGHRGMLGWRGACGPDGRLFR